MQLILHFQTQPVLSKPSICFLSPIVKPKTLLQSTIFVPKARIFRGSISLCHKTQTQKPIVSAKKNKTRNGSQRLTRLLLQLVPVIASNLKILPQPLDLVVDEICGGDSGGGGWGSRIWRKGFGGGRFDGFGGKRNRKMWLLYLFCGVLVISGLGLLFGGEIESNVLCYGLGFALSGVAMVQWWDKIGVFAVFLGGVLVGLGFKRDELQKLGLKLRACYPVTWRTRRRRNGKRAF